MFTNCLPKLLTQIQMVVWVCGRQTDTSWPNYTMNSLIGLGHQRPRLKIIYSLKCTHWRSPFITPLTVALIFMASVLGAHPLFCRLTLEVLVNLWLVKCNSCQRKSAPLWPDVVFWASTQWTHYYFWLTVQLENVALRHMNWRCKEQSGLRLCCECKPCGVLLPWICSLMHHQFTLGVWGFMVGITTCK